MAISRTLFVRGLMGLTCVPCWTRIRFTVMLHNQAHGKQGFRSRPVMSNKSDSEGTLCCISGLSNPKPVKALREGCGFARSNTE